MIKLTRLNRSVVALNPDLVERIEEMPDTVVTLTDGKKILVVESIDDIVEMIMMFRAEVSARSSVIDISRSPQTGLHLVDELSEDRLAVPEITIENVNHPAQSESDDLAIAATASLDENGVR